MVDALARAFWWRKQLDAGVHMTLEELARAKGVHATYVSRVLRLTLLAPEIVEAILDGRQPAGLQLDDLREGFPLTEPVHDRAFLLLGPKRNAVLSLHEVQQYGLDSFADADYLRIYGMAPAEWYGRGIRLLGRTAVECTRDALADRIGRDIADVAAKLSDTIPVRGHRSVRRVLQHTLLDSAARAERRGHRLRARSTSL